MIDDPQDPGPRAGPAIRPWMARADLLFAAGTVLAAGLWLWRQDGEARAAMGALMLPWVLMTATAFALAHRALTRNWKHPWWWQIVGPVLVILMLFGVAWAVGSAVVMALGGWLVLRRHAGVAAGGGP